MGGWPMSLVIVSQFLLPAVVVSIPNLPVPWRVVSCCRSIPLPPRRCIPLPPRRFVVVVVSLYSSLLLYPIPFLLMSFPLLVVGSTPRTCRRWAVFIGFGRLGVLSWHCRIPRTDVGPASLSSNLSPWSNSSPSLNPSPLSNPSLLSNPSPLSHPSPLLNPSLL